MSTNWLESDTKKIRDEGAAAIEYVAPLVDEETGDPVVDQDGNPLQPEVLAAPERPGWREGTYVHIKDSISSLSFKSANRRLKELGDEADQIDQALIYAATFVTAIEGPDFGLAKGEVRQMPESFEERLELVGTPPLPVLMFINQQILEVFSSPLAPTKPARRTGKRSG